MSRFSDNKNLQELLKRLGEVADLSGAAGVLGWDQETYLPPKSAPTRARQLATLSGVIHEKFISPQIGKLLRKLKKTKGLNQHDRSVIRLTQRSYDKSVKIPTALVKALSQATSEGFSAWQEAKETNAFPLFAPHLEKILGLVSQQATILKKRGQSLYDVLLDDYEEGLTTKQVEAVLTPLGQSLRPLIKKYTALTAGADRPVLNLSYPVAKQWHFSKKVATALGFDFERGRLDRSTHPFTTEFSTQDVRITSRGSADDFRPMLMATIHETGHALYDQGINPEFERTPLTGNLSFTIHESQSRLWENVVGRSAPFWEHWFPHFQKAFPQATKRLSRAKIIASLNHVRPSLIRVEADEVSYGLHIIIRFEIEKLLLAGKLKIADLPKTWGDLYQHYLGLRPETDREGVLQDVHWSHGSFGYFPTYALGSLLSAQIMAKAKTDIPDLEEALKKGNFSLLRNYLREKIHQHGSHLPPAKLLQKNLGFKLSPEPFLHYLKDKFGKINH